MTTSNYWEERERAKAEALKMAANLSARERGLVVRATKRALVNEAVRDQIRQRRFERGFLSLEFPKGDGVPYDYSFGSREERRMIRELDAPYWERVREHRFNAALWKLRHHPELQKTLRAIRSLRKREKIISALQIKAETYDLRISRVRKILKILT